MPVGSSVAPGLWSSAETESLVLSGNLPLMAPLFRRVGHVLGIRTTLRSKEQDDESRTLTYRLEQPVQSRHHPKDENLIAPGCTPGVDTAVISGSKVSHSQDEYKNERTFIPQDAIVVNLDLQQDVSIHGSSKRDSADTNSAV